LLRLSAKEIEVAYKKNENPALHVKELLESGESERALRNTLLGKLDQELKTTPGQETKIIERIGLEIQNQNTALEHIAAMMRFVNTLETKQDCLDQITSVSIEEIDKYLRMHRIAENEAYLETVSNKIDAQEAEQGVTPYIAKTKEYVQELSKPEIFVADGSVYEEKYESFDQAKSGLKDTILLNSIEDNLNFLNELLGIGNNELAARAGYLKKHSAYKKGSARYFLYVRELDEQRALIKKTQRFLEFVSQELAKLQEVKKLNDAASQRFKVIAEKIQDKQPALQAELLAADLQQLVDPEQKLGVAAKFLLNSSAEDIIEKTKEIINKGSVNKYKILIALYNIIDQQQDHDAKVKILDEFCRYLEETRYELYLQLKDLLDTQRNNLLNQYRIKRAKISDLWRVLETQQKREDKIKYLNELLADSEWSMFYSYVENIRQGLLAENVDDMLTRNKHLALEDQQDLLQKIKLFRLEEYDTPEINEKLSRKLLELSARQSVLKDTKTKVFSPQDYSFIMRIPANEEKIMKSINSTLFKAEREAVEKEFKAQGISQHEIAQYITTNLHSGSDISTFTFQKPKEKIQSRQTAPLAQDNHETEITQEKQKAIEKTQKPTPAAQEKDTREKEKVPASTVPAQGFVENERQEAGPNEKQGTNTDKIEDVAAALNIFGPVQKGAEQELISEIQKLVYNKKITEAVSKIQNDVVWESGKSGEIDKMSRLLYSLKELSVIHEHEEVNDFLEKQLQTLSSVIINEAHKKTKEPSKQSALLRERNGEVPVPEKQAPGLKEVESVAQVEEKAKQGLRTLIMSLEGLREFTNLHTFAEQRDFEEEEEQRLARIMNELTAKGHFIYLEKEQLLLGGGMLKPLIERAFDQQSIGKPVTIDPNLLKKAWDFIRTRGNIKDQLRLIGVSSREERSDLFKELEKMLRPHGVPVHQLTKKKMYAKAESESQDKEAPEQEQTEEKDLKYERALHTKGAVQEKRRGLFTARAKPKKKPKAGRPVKKIDYSGTLRKYINQSYAPVLMDYMKRMYRKKKDFFIPISGRKQYYDIEILRRSVEGILRKDARGKYHTDLLHSLKHDEKLFSRIVSELFIEHKTKNGDRYYFPKFLKGEIELS